MTELIEVTQDQKELLRATNFANEQHAGQYRKGSGLPYIVHPISVLKQVREWGVRDTHTLQAAVAHDILEEKPNVTIEALGKVIGKKAAAIVAELTFVPDLQSTVSVGKQKELYLESFLTKSVQALIIKVSDRCCNSLDFFHSGSGSTGTGGGGCTAITATRTATSCSTSPASTHLGSATATDAGTSSSHRIATPNPSSRRISCVKRPCPTRAIRRTASSSTESPTIMTETSTTKEYERSCVKLQATSWTP